jgi:hypothetical protein
MEADRDVAELLGRTADERLLEAPPDDLPAALGHPPALPQAPGRRAIVAAGAVMTGLSLVLGVALAAWAVVASFTEGADLVRGIEFLVGLVLAGTHWGWVHVAELSATSLSARHGRGVIDARHAWLAAIEPYTRREVVTEVEPDGSIAIVTREFRPIARPRGRFAFARDELHRERLPEETPTAAVAERVEALRRAAAEATARRHEDYLELTESEGVRALLSADERARLEERRATARALSERLNAHLRDPPLDL